MLFPKDRSRKIIHILFVNVHESRIIRSLFKLLLFRETKARDANCFVLNGDHNDEHQTTIKTHSNDHIHTVQDEQHEKDNNNKNNNNNTMSTVTVSRSEDPGENVPPVETGTKPRTQYSVWSTNNVRSPVGQNTLHLRATQVGSVQVSPNETALNLKNNQQLSTRFNAAARDPKMNPSFLPHMLKLEKLARIIGMNLLAKNYKLQPHGDWLPVPYPKSIIFLIKSFLWIYIIRELVGSLLVDKKDDEMMLFIGDFTNIYGEHVDRFGFNAFKFAWGLHAFIMYAWITRNNGHHRKWLANFENRWMQTLYYVDPNLEHESLAAMRRSRRFVTYFVYVTSTVATILATMLNIYGFFSDEVLAQKWSTLYAVIYFSWCAAHMVWFWITFIINMTSFGHHFILCRAIHIRFDETKKDLEYAILSEHSSETRPEQISGLITKHFFVCDMVKQANKHLKIYLFIFYIIFAPHLCVMIYQIAFSSSSTTQGKIFIGFLVILSDSFQVYSVSVMSAQITSKSHDPYYAMHGVNKFDNLPENIQLQATLFMQRISNTVVGLTILDSFVLTGGLISSLITAIVTYFSVILESS